MARVEGVEGRGAVQQRVRDVLERWPRWAVPVVLGLHFALVLVAVSWLLGRRDGGGLLLQAAIAGPVFGVLVGTRVLRQLDRDRDLRRRVGDEQLARARRVARGRERAEDPQVRALAAELLAAEADLDGWSRTGIVVVVAFGLLFAALAVLQEPVWWVAVGAIVLGVVVWALAHQRLQRRAARLVENG